MSYKDQEKPVLPKDPELGVYLAYAWPGGYPIYYLTRDGLTVCPDCANKDCENPEQEVIASGINYEDPRLYCDDCWDRIESAYAEE